jgi:DNA gyrase subunit A
MCPKADDEGRLQGYLTLVTRHGKIKRLAAEDIRSIRGSGILIGLDEGDQVVSAFATDGAQEVVVCAANGQGIRFSEEEVRPMGLAAGGVLAMKLGDQDTVVAAMPVAASEAQIAILSRLGYGKRIALKDFPAQKRYGAGVVVAKVTARTGPLACAVAVGGGETLWVRTSAAKGYALAAADLPLMARAAQGKAVLTLRKAELVEGIVALGAATAEPAPQRKRKPKAAAAPASRPPAEKAPARKGAPQATAEPAKTAKQKAKRRPPAERATEPAKPNAARKSPATTQATKPAPTEAAPAREEAKPPTAPRRKPTAAPEASAAHPTPAQSPKKKAPKPASADRAAKKKPVRSVPGAGKKSGK